MTGGNALNAKLGAAHPHALEAEQALLGAILHNAEALDRARGHVKAEYFSENLNRQIYEAMCRRRDEGGAIDLGLMKAVLGDVDLGGLTLGRYLGNLMSGATTVINAPDYAKQITEAAHMRMVLDAAQDAVHRMTDGTVASPAAYATHLIETLDEVASAGLSANVRRVTLREGAAAAMARVREVRAGKGIQGVTYGLPSLDRVTLGMRRNQLIILAGRPAMGKTAVAVHVGLAAARRAGPVALFSLEMDASELSERVLSALVFDHREFENITYRSIAEARGLSDEAIYRLDEAQRLCSAIPLWIEQQPGLSLAQIAARSRQMKLKAERQGLPLSLLIVDHMGLISPSGRYAGNRVQEMTEISGGLKGLAKELGLPILALSQLSRQVESRDDKRPKLADLRDSGSLEQDADVVIGLYREAYYLGRKPDPTDIDVDNLARLTNRLEIEILKQRSGPTPRIDVYCNIGCNVLADLAQ